jgi:hypothetical protein
LLYVLEKELSFVSLNVAAPSLDLWDLASLRQNSTLFDETTVHEQFAAGICHPWSTPERLILVFLESDNKK